MYEIGILMHMRTTLNIDDGLLEQAMEVTGLKEKTAVVHAGLTELIRRDAARRLIAAGGTMPGLKLARRRRPPNFRRP
jgi:Arc/MetJ family transcription regulator